MSDARGKSRVLYRVDPRLVHATLMNAWVPAFGVEWIIVADGKVQNDVRQRTIFEMSVMDAAEIFFTSEAEVAQALRGMVLERTAIVLFSSLESAHAAIQHGLDVGELIIGHLPRTAERTEEVHPAVHLGPSDRAIITAIEGKNVKVVVQPLPDEPRRAITESVLPAVVSMRAPDTPKFTTAGATCTQTLEVVNERGLHLRAAHVLASLAGRLDVEVLIGRDGTMVNAKSLLGLTTLGAARGTMLDVTVRGAGSDAAMARIRALFESGFDEGAQS